MHKYISIFVIFLVIVNVMFPPKGEKRRTLMNEIVKPVYDDFGCVIDDVVIGIYADQD